MKIIFCKTQIGLTSNLPNHHKITLYIHCLYANLFCCEKEKCKNTKKVKFLLYNDETSFQSRKVKMPFRLCLHSDTVKCKLFQVFYDEL